MASSNIHGYYGLAISISHLYYHTKQCCLYSIIPNRTELLLATHKKRIKDVGLQSDAH